MDSRVDSDTSSTTTDEQSGRRRDQKDRLGNILTNGHVQDDIDQDDYELLDADDALENGQANGINGTPKDAFCVECSDQKVDNPNFAGHC